MNSANSHDPVKDQYEAYPYPQREPRDELERLAITSVDDFARLNHYCFSGKRNFNKDFRALIAGGGTGDGLIFLAEQLRGSKHEIVYLDVSSSSSEIAKKRAEIRGLADIHWLQGSLLDLPDMDVGKFDYINCTGVLHHLHNPTAGLQALEHVLADGGAMGIMIYGKYGRTGIYQIQDLMRLINSDETDMVVKVENTSRIIESLPPTNWFKRAPEVTSDHIRYGATGIYDLFLHSTDRAYSVPELYSWLESCGLELIEFTRNRHFLDPSIP